MQDAVQSAKPYALPAEMCQLPRMTSVTAKAWLLRQSEEQKQEGNWTEKPLVDENNKKDICT